MAAAPPAGRGFPSFGIPFGKSSGWGFKAQQQGKKPGPGGSIEVDGQREGVEKTEPQTGELQATASLSLPLRAANSLSSPLEVKNSASTALAPTRSGMKNLFFPPSQQKVVGTPSLSSREEVGPAADVSEVDTLAGNPGKQPTEERGLKKNEGGTLPGSGDASPVTGVGRLGAALDDELSSHDESSSDSGDSEDLKVFSMASPTVDGRSISGASQQSCTSPEAQSPDTSARGTSFARAVFGFGKAKALNRSTSDNPKGNSVVETAGVKSLKRASTGDHSASSAKGDGTTRLAPIASVTDGVDGKPSTLDDLSHDDLMRRVAGALSRTGSPVFLDEPMSPRDGWHAAMSNLDDEFLQERAMRVVGASYEPLDKFRKSVKQLISAQEGMQPAHLKWKTRMDIAEMMSQV